MNMTEIATDIPVTPVVTQAQSSAQTIESEANEVLQNSQYPELKHITCEFAGGVLILRGRVRSYFMKQMAQESLRNFDGVDHISNAIRVADR